MSASKDKAGSAPAVGKKNRGAEAADAAGLSDEAVREFLKENGDFLQRNPDLLDHLHVSHASGSAVSLVEKQVSVLRERNVDIRHRLKALTTNARENDKLFEQTRALVVKLLEADSVAGLYSAFMDSMKNGFEVEFASMILFGEEPADGDYRVERLEDARSHIGALFSGRKAVCGALRKEEFNYLFTPGGSAHHFQQGGSAAIMPLADGSQLGLIAVGSADAGRYTSAMGTLFLSHIAEVIMRLLPRFSPAGA
ncbi:MAG: DUF484 family protein [Gammaproteobacteria bacterium]|jgi:uncharacterized protein YigA (DUF484 family)|nr:DUF484 family protein [Gammaproteobacteria bacterium]